MAHVEWAETAIAALDRLILSHSLTNDTRERVKHSLRPLERFPRFGPELAGLADAKELRFVIGPWPWLILVYLYGEADDVVTLVSPEDGRSAATTIARRRPT